MDQIKYRKNEHGAATIFVSIMLLIAMTLATFYTARVNLEEQRISGNDYRGKEAFNAADAGLDHIMTRLKKSTTLPLNMATITMPNDATYGVTVTAGVDAWEAVANGTSADGTGSSIVRQKLDFYNLLGNGVDAPLTVAGSVGIGGTMEVVANPNGGGDGVPISVWSSEPVSFSSGSSSSCNLAEYLAGGSPDSDLLCDPTDCGCDSEAISNSVNGNQYDVVDEDSKFPPDLFEHTFGVPVGQWETIRDLANSSGGIIPNADITQCSELDSTASGLYWVDGDCQIAASQVVGSLDSPVIIVVDGNVSLQGGASVFGVIYAFSSDNDPDTGGTVTINGNNIVYGSVISDHDVAISNGTFHVRYDSRVINNIINGDDFAVLAKVANSWRDF